MNRQLTLITDNGQESRSVDQRVRPGRPGTKGEIRRRREAAARRRGREAARATAQRARENAERKQASEIEEHNRALFAQLAAMRGKATIPVPVPRRRPHDPTDGGTPHAA